MGGMGLIALAQDSDRQLAVVNAAMNFWVLQTAENFLSNRGPISFSRRSFAAWSWLKQLRQNTACSVGDSKYRELFGSQDPVTYVNKMERMFVHTCNTQ